MPVRAYDPSELQQAPADAVGGGDASVPPQPEGFFHSLGAQFGITPEAGEARRQEMLQHPVKTTLKDLAGPVLPLAEGVASYGKRLFHDAYDAGQSLAAGNPSQAGVDAIDAIPILGPAELKAADQYGEGNIAGAAGTAMGAAPQGALALEGGLRSLGREPHFIPSTARAGAGFESLKTDLADHPVQLKASLRPLQAIAEHAEAGSGLPGPANKLLIRSQGIEPLTYPEARRFQENLASYVREQGVTGSMGGALKDLNRTLYDDIHESLKPIGRAEDYAGNMKEYRQGSQLKNITKKAAGAAATGAAGYAGLQGVKRFLEASSK